MKIRKLLELMDKGAYVMIRRSPGCGDAPIARSAGELLKDEQYADIVKQSIGHIRTVTTVFDQRPYIVVYSKEQP